MTGSNKCFAVVLAVAGMLTAAAVAVDRTGTSDADVLVRTAGNDNLNGLGGDDRIFGLGGNDAIDGGSNDDLINGDACPQGTTGVPYYCLPVGRADRDNLKVAAGRTGWTATGGRSRLRPGVATIGSPAGAATTGSPADPGSTLPRAGPATTS